MKKLFNKIGFASLFIFASVPAFADESGNELCELIGELQGVFKTLRVLAFLGAGFILAKYAWEAISTGKIGGKDYVEGIKNIGVPMLIGVALLFGIGVVLGMLINGRIGDCVEILKTGW